jgi:lipid-A-disaccharide synthase
MACSSRPLRLVLTAAEPSGDRLAAEIFLALRAEGPVEARGVCGPHMRAAGIEPIGDIGELSAMGVVEVLRTLPAIFRTRRRLARTTETLFVGVDAPDLHLPLARRLRRAGRRVVQVVCPQVWAWRAGRIPQIARSVDRLLCLFPFEVGLFSHLPEAHNPARFMGHPAWDRVFPRGKPGAPQLLGLCPGSRSSEIARHWPVFWATFLCLREQIPGLNAVILDPTGRCGPLPSSAVRVRDVQEMQACGRVLSKSGTVTLELARLGVPMVVAQQVHPLTYQVARWFVRGTDQIALPNILHRKETGEKGPIPEFVQELTPRNLASALAALPLDPAPLRLPAGLSGAALRAATEIRSLGGDR